MRSFAVHAADLARGGSHAVGHIMAVIVGFALMILGIGMGITVVLIPFGVPVGFFGLGLFAWGLMEHAERKHPAPHD